MRRYLQVYVLLLIAIGLTVSGEILLKLGMNLVSAEVGAFSLNLPVLLRTFTEWRIILGFALIFGGSLFWLGVISRAPLAAASSIRAPTASGRRSLASGPIMVSGSSPLPTFTFRVRSANPFRKAS